MVRALSATGKALDITDLQCLLQGALAHRVLGLLWELTFAPGAPAEVAQSPVLSDSLHHYAGMGSDGIDMVWDYIKRCISQVLLCCHETFLQSHCDELRPSKPAYTQ